MHIHIVPNRQSTPTVLLRESFRQDGKIKKRTLANLSSLPANQIELIRAVLRGDALAPATAAFEITRSRAHGHVQVVTAAMKRLEIHKLLASQASPERDRVIAMIAARILRPQTKLSTVRWWETTTLADEAGVSGATEDDLYAAMDWLLERQDAIQAKLARRHLQDGAVALYDLSSSYYEGATCPLAKRGYSRDGKQGTLQVNYGLLADSRGCPVAVTVYDGNIGDPSTFGPEVDRLKQEFVIDRVVLVADRGMISQKAVDALKTQQGVDWISALKTVSIRALVESGAVQLDLFDDRNLFEATAPDYPGERLIACRNAQLAKLRGHKRGELLATTEAALLKISERVKAGRLTGKDRIGLAIGKVINRRKMEKHIQLDIAEDSFTFSRDEKRIKAEAALDGVYIIRTSLDADHMSAPDCVRTYKSLAKVEL